MKRYLLIAGSVIVFVSASTQTNHRIIFTKTEKDVIPEGIDFKSKIKNVEGVDFWSEAKGHGKEVVTHVSKPTIERNKATLVVTIEHPTFGC
jgi:hypothetical protein